jgi:hypothetical protein
LFLSPVGLALLGGTLLVVVFKLVDWTAELLWFRADAENGAAKRRRLWLMWRYSTAPENIMQR